MIRESLNNETANIYNNTFSFWIIITYEYYKNLLEISRGNDRR